MIGRTAKNLKPKRVCKALGCKNTLVWKHNHCTKHHNYKCQVCGAMHDDEDN